LEILLVVGIIAILAGIVILAINPSKQLGDTRNAQRRSDVLTILNAVYQYSIDNNGDLDTITDLDGALEQAETCDDAGTDALDLYDSLVSASSTYLTDIPHDPLEDGVSTSGYFVVQKDSDRVIVCIDPDNEENGISIEIER